MWPLLLDMTKEESMQNLRCLEIEAFSGVVSALRAQGALDNDKLKVIKDMGSILHISQERHKAEIRRVVNDEQLNTIAYYVNGEKHCVDEWMDEGRRLIPLVARVAPQTAYSAVADEVADHASKINKTLPLPASTERKRLPLASPTHSNSSASDVSSKNFQFRTNEPDSKKRKISVGPDGGNLPCYLMGPPKMSKIQQIYRQKTKAKQKEQLMKLKAVDIGEYALTPHLHQKLHHHQTFINSQTLAQNKQNVNQIDAIHQSQNSPKINILQNINVASITTTDQLTEEQTNVLENEIVNPQPCCSNDSIQFLNKSAASPSINKINHVTIKPKPGVSDLEKNMKVSATRKTIPPKTVTTSTGQKLLVVPNTQTSSILQRTLTTIPFKNIKTLDKFKIVPSINNPPQPQSTTIAIQNTKQKVVTVRTTNKKFSQVQLLNTKGGIKVLPLSGKLLAKNNSNIHSSVCVMNTCAHDGNDGTKSISSTPVLMSSKQQENIVIKENNPIHIQSEEKFLINKININNTVDPPIVPIYNDVQICDNVETNTMKDDCLIDKCSSVVSQDMIYEEKNEVVCDNIVKCSDIDDVELRNEDEIKEFFEESNMPDTMDKISKSVEEKISESMDVDFS